MAFGRSLVCVDVGLCVCQLLAAKQTVLSTLQSVFVHCVLTRSSWLCVSGTELGHGRMGDGSIAPGHLNYINVNRCALSACFGVRVSGLQRNSIVVHCVLVPTALHGPHIYVAPLRPQSLDFSLRAGRSLSSALRAVGVCESLVCVCGSWLCSTSPVGAPVACRDGNLLGSWHPSALGSLDIPANCRKVEARTSPAFVGLAATCVKVWCEQHWCRGGHCLLIVPG